MSQPQTKSSRTLVLARLLMGLVGILIVMGPSGCPLKQLATAQDPDGYFLFSWPMMMMIDPPAQDAPSTPTVPYFAFLHRETNCSLTRIATDATLNILSTFPNYQDYIHRASQLTSTPDVFPNGCQTSTVGISSQSGALLGTTSAGNFVGATLTSQGIEVFVVSPTGTIISGPTQISTTGTAGPGNFAASAGMSVADLNGDGIPDLVVASSGFSAPNVGTLTVFINKGDGTFQTPTTINLTIPVTGVTIDDVNSDGKFDLVATALQNPGATTTGLNVLLGDGRGGFGVPIPGPAGVSAIVSVTGDFNKDGKKDIATNTGQILLGNNDGTFTLQPNVLINQSFSTTGGPGVVGVAAGDFNHDGNIDLAFSNQNAVTLDVYLGHGDGTFSYGSSYAAVYGANNLVSTDLDGDGVADIFLGTYAGTGFAADQTSDGMFQSFLGRGDGTFVAAPAYIPLGPGASGINFFDVADFNGDKKPDMVTIDSDSINGPYLSVELGNGDGTFKTQPPIPLTADFNSAGQVGGFLAADVDGDGKSDVVFARTNNSQQAIISVLIGKGTGTFATQVDYDVPAPVVALISLDLNGDKKPDLAFIGNPGNSFPPTATVLYVMLNKGDGTFAAPVQIDAKPYLGSLAVGDVSGDGIPDLIATAAGDVSNNVAGATYLYVSKGNGTLAAAQTLNGGMFPGAAAVADMNGDGKLDVVVSGSTTITTGYVNVLLNNGGDTFITATAASTDDAFPASVAVADVNADGKPDVIVSGCCGLAFSVYLQGNGDGTFLNNAGADPPLAVSTTQVKLVDVNNDGAPDFLAVSNGLALEVFLNPLHSQTVTAPTTTALAASASTITAGQSVTFTATVAPVSGTGIPTGSVTFFDGTTAIGTVAVNGSGIAMLMTSTLAQGTHPVTATYGGDLNFASSASTAVSVQVNAAALIGTTAGVTGPATATHGASVTFTATITPASGTAKPTGIVTFLDGGTALGTGTLNSSGVATFSTAALTTGVHSVTAQYPGDATFSASTSPAISITINAAALIGTTTMLTGPSTAAAGASVSFMASVTPASGTKTPTGTVSFLDGTTSLGTGTLNASGSATFATSALAAGSHSITASYGGDTSFTSSASSALSINITAAGSFTLAANPAAITVTRGHAGSSVITVTPANGFNQPIQFSCGALPEGIDCAFQPSSVTPNGGPASTTLTISEDATNNIRRGNSQAFNTPKIWGDSAGRSLPFHAPIVPILGGELLMLWAFWRNRKLSAGSPLRFAAAFVFLLSIATFVGGCTGSPNPKSSTTTITITATAGAQSVPLPIAVTVQN
jgi:Bacterial Ig-like domain (group 3)/FG-GAP-like repeat